MKGMKGMKAIEGRVFDAWVGGCWDVASLSKHLRLPAEVIRAAAASFNEKQKQQWLGLIDVKEKMTNEEWAAERERLLDQAVDMTKTPIVYGGREIWTSPSEAASCVSTLCIHVSEYEVRQREREKAGTQ